MRILGIETSCDETGASVVQDGTHILSNIIATSQGAFTASGGVIPERAARKQVESILPTMHLALKEANVKISELDAIAVTRGPGLLVSLLVGSTVARTVSSINKIPLVGVHHTLGHLSSTWLDSSDEPRFPLIALSASGGHTDLWYRVSHTRGELLGSTRDDAAGEAFDKGAQMLSLPYPGGPSIAQAAQDGDPKAFAFPIPLKGEDDLSFSFSGLKTALKYTLKELAHIDEQTLKNLAASYQHTICFHLVDRIVSALRKHDDVHEVHLVGGVSANMHLRSLVEDATVECTLRTPVKIQYCTDNAAMIAAAGFFLMQERGEGAFEAFETMASLPLCKAMGRSIGITD